MRTIPSFRHVKTPFIFIFSFILGSMFTISITPVDRNCMIQNTDPEHNMMKNSKLKNPDLIIIILSAPNNIEKRKSVRETWLKLYRPNHERHDHDQFKVRHYFTIGSLGLNTNHMRQLDLEQSQNKDILLVPMYDHYKNLTEKVKSVFKWLDEQIDYGLGFEYVLKCDDDSFVNLNALISELLNIERLYLISDLQNALQLILTKKSSEMTMNVQLNDKLASENHLNLYWGYFSGTARIKTKGKWKESDWIVSDKYTPYALGGGYILSRNLIRYVARNAENLRYTRKLKILVLSLFNLNFRSFNSEDVSVGLWLASINSILRIHDIRFDTEWATRGCQNKYLVTHSISPTDMRILFNNIKTYRKLCPQEIKKRNFYLYNWSMPPSQCCKPAENNVIPLAKH